MTKTYFYVDIPMQIHEKTKSCMAYIKITARKREEKHYNWQMIASA